jgi:uncharacterized protein (DUF58 family)
MQSNAVIASRCPLPTRRAALWLAVAMLPALLSVAWLPAAVLSPVLLLIWIAVLLLDARSLTSVRLRGARNLPELMLAFATNPLTLELENVGPVPSAGQWLELLPDGTEASGTFALASGERVALALAVRPPRGALSFGEVHLRLQGNRGLCVRDLRLPVSGTVKCYPDLRQPGDALLLARPRLEGGLARLRRMGQGREFDALRPYREGDDLRALDWKATARRGQLVSREYAPEKNQTVLLLLDCGRHLVAQEGGRSKLDHTVEAALRLARASLEHGDGVGLIAFGSTLRAFVAPARGRAALRGLTEACYALQPELEESDYAVAFDQVARASVRRALVCTFTDVVEADASRLLLARTLALKPRHLPLVLALRDSALLALERAIPGDVDAAFARAAAVRLIAERTRAMAMLRAGGAAVVWAAPTELAAGAINAYLRVKERGRL